MELIEFLVEEVFAVCFEFRINVLKVKMDFLGLGNNGESYADILYNKNHKEAIKYYKKWSSPLDAQQHENSSYDLIITNNDLLDHKMMDASRMKKI